MGETRWRSGLRREQVNINCQLILPRKTFGMFFSGYYSGPLICPRDKRFGLKSSFGLQMNAEMQMQPLLMFKFEIANKILLCYLRPLAQCDYNFSAIYLLWLDLQYQILLWAPLRNEQRHDLAFLFSLWLAVYVGRCNKTYGIRPKMLKNNILEQDLWNRAY